MNKRLLVAVAIATSIPAFSKAQPSPIPLLEDSFSANASAIHSQPVEKGPGIWSAASAPGGNVGPNNGVLNFASNTASSVSIPIPSHAADVIELQATAHVQGTGYIGLGLETTALTGSIGHPTNLNGLNIINQGQGGLIYVHFNGAALNLDSGINYYFVPNYTGGPIILKLRYNAQANSVSGFANGVQILSNYKLLQPFQCNFAGIISHYASGTVDNFSLNSGAEEQLGDVYLTDGFDDPNFNTLFRWGTTLYFSQVPNQLGKALQMSSVGGSNNVAYRILSDQVRAALAGRRVSVSLSVKGDGVSGGNPMLFYSSPSFGNQWLTINSNNQATINGTYDWKTVGLRTFIPADVTDVTVYLGLGNPSAGTMTYDNLRVEADPIVFDDTMENTPSSRWVGTSLTNISVPGYGNSVRISSGEATYTFPSTAPKDLLNILRGRRVLLTARVKATNVTRTTNPAQGIQLNLRYTVNGVVTNNRAIVDLGPGTRSATTGWMNVVVPLVIPEQATAASVAIGLNGSGGTADFDNVRIEMNSSIFHENFADLKLTKARFGDLSSDSLIIQRTIRGFDSRVLQIIPSGGYAFHFANLSVEALRNRTVALRAQLKGNNLQGVNPATGSSGFISMWLLYWTPNSTYPVYQNNYVRTLDPSVNLANPSFDWVDVAGSFYLPANATKATLLVGTSHYSSGTLEVANIRVDTLEASQVDWTNPTPFPAFSGRPIPGQIGRGLNTEPGPASAVALMRTAWNANHTRWELGSYGYYIGGVHDLENFNPQIEAALSAYDAISSTLTANGMVASLCMYGATDKLFEGVNAAQVAQGHSRIVAKWRELAERYKNDPTVWAYDIANEPIDYTAWTPNNLNWNELAEQIAIAIREVDPEKPIVVSSANHATIDAFQWLRPVRAGKVIYQFHYYMPYSYTHQLVTPLAPNAFSYPGWIDGAYWDANKIEASIQPIVQFQNRHKVPIYIGEFSVARWAPNGAQYLDDVISAFERHGWDWAYWIFRTASVWNLEIPDNLPFNDTQFFTNPPSRTLRGDVVRRWLSYNPPVAGGHPSFAEIFPGFATHEEVGGVPALIAYALGGSVSGNNRDVLPLSSLNGDFLEITFLARANDPQLLVSAEGSFDLNGEWSAPVHKLRGVDQSGIPAGFERQTWILETTGNGFIRVKATLLDEQRQSSGGGN